MEPELPQARVLVIDGGPAACLLLTRSLSREQFRCHHCGRADEPLRVMRRQPLQGLALSTEQQGP